MVFSQPPLFSSDWQFEHQGAQRWTTLIWGDLIASANCCSAGEAARSEDTAKNEAKIRTLNGYILWVRIGRIRVHSRPHLTQPTNGYIGREATLRVPTSLFGLLGGGRSRHGGGINGLSTGAFLLPTLSKLIKPKIN